MENKTEEKVSNEEIKEIKEEVSDKIEKIGSEAKNVVFDLKDKYQNASPAMQKVTIAIIAAIIASTITLLKLIVFQYCISRKSNTTNK